jgi:hypothetical protein
MPGRQESWKSIGDCNNTSSGLSYFATAHGYYELYVDMLMEMSKKAPVNGHHATAPQASERTGPLADREFNRCSRRHSMRYCSGFAYARIPNAQ